MFPPLADQQNTVRLLTRLCITSPTCSCMCVLVRVNDTNKTDSLTNCSIAALGVKKDTFFYISVSSPEESQPKKQSIASRLSEKFQSSLNSDRERDDDFQPDRKRMRTTENKVAMNDLHILLYIYTHCITNLKDEYSHFLAL